MAYLRPCPHDTFATRSWSIANDSRPVARVHTGDTGTLVPVSRDHLASRNQEQAGANQYNIEIIPELSWVAKKNRSMYHLCEDGDPYILILNNRTEWNSVPSEWNTK